MVNVTQYLKERGSFSSTKGKGHYSYATIHCFLRMERVKYFIGNQQKVIAKPGRYDGGTFFSEDLFEMFKNWLDRKPLPLLNRKEYEVSSFISTYYPDCVGQYKVGEYIFDWYVPSYNLLIEFNEKSHALSRIKQKDLAKSASVESVNLFTISETTVMQDLAKLVKLYPA